MLKMKKLNLTLIATIITAFAISMFVFQPATTEASSAPLPAPTPSPIKIKRKVKTTNFSFGTSQTGSMRRKRPTRIKRPITVKRRRG